MKKLRWFLFNGMFACMMYFGFVDGVEGAYNIAMFIAWLNIIVSFFMLTESFIERLKTQERFIPALIAWSYSLGIAFTLVWFGAFITGIFYVIGTIFREGARYTAEKQLADSKDGTQCNTQ